MSHPITHLQTQFIAALDADSTLFALIGADAVFDHPPKAKTSPYVCMARHDLLSRNTDAAPGHEHRVQFDIWFPKPDRTGALAIAERVVDTLLAADLDDAELIVTHRRHVRTDTRIEPKSGHARASIQMLFLTEPAA